MHVLSRTGAMLVVQSGSQASDDMNTAQTSERYQQLRQDLESAYTDEQWDALKIDRIADELARVEKVLAASAVRARRLHRFEVEQVRPQNFLL